VPDIFLIFVIVLFVLAISDLVVGVSNDAVNFLNSAIGSKVANLRHILIIASIGVFVGATFSSGMMEVARKGIFNPEFFVFSEIIFIFLAVMLTDILLLDVFNTLGLPTSTTVSIVFELLGAAVIISLLKINAAGQSWSALGDYINTSSAVQIISGIFLSILIAFAIGMIIQYFSRLLFTFHYQKKIQIVGALWSGFALTALTYFLLIKGLKGASFVSDHFLEWMAGHKGLLLAGTFAFWSLFMQVCIRILKWNILRFIVLFGTFALAMAFAGNDLVNFIGVPIAGLESFQVWRASGQEADQFLMDVLRQPVRTKTYLLVVAGLIMIVTLWFSKKARSVTETEINLGRQTEGHERFSSNFISRGIVRCLTDFTRALKKILPHSISQKIENRFIPNGKDNTQGQKNALPPAFDLVRASVNLTVASALIAWATSLKLPLSTTYVSFMVAMGTSLADRAWGRDSAVYRVSGVLNVIAGWFTTAFVAFTVSGFFAFLIYSFSIWAVGSIIIIILAMITYTSFYHRRKEKKKKDREIFEKHQEEISIAELESIIILRIKEMLQDTKKLYAQCLQGLVNEDRKLLKACRKSLHHFEDKNLQSKEKLYGSIKRIKETENLGSKTFLFVFDLETDLLQSMQYVVHNSSTHVENIHCPLNQDQIDKLFGVDEALQSFLDLLSQTFNPNSYPKYKMVKTEKKRILKLVERYCEEQIKLIKSQKSGVRNSLLFFGILLETKDIVAVTARLYKLFRRYKEQAPSNGTLITSEEPVSSDYIDTFELLPHF
jgi:phosphate/sulfate permease